jgi:ATP-dependent protease Clp ATPase subunit
MDQLKCNSAYTQIKKFACYFLIGKNELVYGFSNSQSIISAILDQNIIEEEEIKVVKTSDLKDRFDFTTYAISVRQAIKNIDANDLLAYCEKRVQGQDLELKKAVFLIWQYLQCVTKGKTFQAANWFLTAPSGCGKTELYRTIRKYFQDHQIPIPVVQIDLSRITEEGFKGLDPSNLIDLIKNEQRETTGYAICFLDEADKKLLPSYDVHGENVNQSVQSGLLTLIEGTSSEMDKDGFSKCFDTSKTMFVFMGAFQDLRNDRQKRAACSHTVGFNISDTEESINATDSFYSPITIDDIIRFGMVEELAGRIQQVINFKRMSDESMLQLIRCKSAEIGEEIGIHILLSDQAERELLSVAFGNLGVRTPINRIRELVINTLAVAFFDGNIKENEICIHIRNMKEAQIGKNKCSIHKSK